MKDKQSAKKADLTLRYKSRENGERGAARERENEKGYYGKQKIFSFFNK